MKRSFKTLFYFLVAGSFAVACNNGTDSSTTSADSSSTAKNSTTTSADTSSKMANTTASNANADQDCINTLVSKNETEMDWLMSGIANGGKDVKDHAKMMLADHKALGEKVKAYIAKKGLSTPTVDTTGAVSIMAAKGKEWDKAFTDKMVADHSELLDKLKTYETSVKDDELKTIVKGAEPVVKKHLDMAKMAQGKM